MVDDGVHNRLWADAEYLLNLARQIRQVGQPERASIIQNAGQRFLGSAGIFQQRTRYLFVTLAGHVSAACSEGELNLRRDIQQRALDRFVSLSGDVCPLDQSILCSLYFCLAVGRRGDGKQAPAGLRRQIVPIFQNMKNNQASSEDISAMINLINKMCVFLEYSSADPLKELLDEARVSVTGSDYPSARQRAIDSGEG
jgi:hypothetical protein